MTSSPSRTTIRIGHSPDPDDAFMWFPLANDPTRFGPDGKPLTPRIPTGDYDFVHILEDIQSLNLRSQRGELEITALSIAQYPFVADQYMLTSCGSSMGDNYGPMVVAPRRAKPRAIDELTRLRIAVPGERTSAFLALSLLLGKGNFRYEVVEFDRIIDLVTAGEFDAGLIIHEGQLTFQKAGLDLVVDLGKWWMTRTGLPLPLGGNAIRRDLGPRAIQEIAGILLQSIRYALEHREECLRYALGFGRGLDLKLADEFVGMYVNKWTLDYGPRGRDAVRRFLQEGAAAGIVPPCAAIDFA